MREDHKLITDPFLFKEMCWPNVKFYDKQIEIVQSVVENDETYVPAGNMLGKDFIAGFICIWAFLAHPVCRIVTTSVKDDHLRVLWGEIGRFIQTSKYSFDKVLNIKHRDIRKVVNGVECEISYLLGMVSEKGEGMAGHHAPYSMQVIDEASGVDNLVYTQGDTWAKRKLIFGNCNECPPTHFFRAGIAGGDLLPV